MIKFLIKGLFRDRSRSLFPVLTVFSGVFLAVLLYSIMNGVIADMINSTARYQTGHVKVMTQAYAEEANQTPNDLALTGINEITQILKDNYPDMIWTTRIKFGGLLDIPDEKGETKKQGPVTGLAVDLFSPSSPEWGLLRIEKSIIRGRIPKERGEILIGDEFAGKLNIGPGDTATLISSTMFGSMAIYNFKIAGTVSFGISAMDRGAILADIADIQDALDMQDTAGELLGYFPDDIYNDEKAVEIAASFNKQYKDPDDRFSPLMRTLPVESGLTDYITIIDSMGVIMVSIFIAVMSIVLWNSGLMGSLRRYGEIGVRLAVGENKTHIYKTLILESLFIGIFGSILGTAAGTGVSYLMQIYGIDYGYLMKNSSMMISNVYRARVSTGSFFIGFIPGIASTVLGASIAGIGIYRRQTAGLFKELEV